MSDTAKLIKAVRK